MCGGTLPIREALQRLAREVAELRADVEALRTRLGA
jgi:ubiquinone biosynthesis protein UbiJ